MFSIICLIFQIESIINEKYIEAKDAARSTNAVSSTSVRAEVSVMADRKDVYLEKD